jgi:parallel beta-helix repeat protein
MMFVMGFLAVATLASVEPAKPLTLYVATDGNDSWSGRPAAPNDKGTDGPFRTLVRARDAIREIKKNGAALSGPLTVRVRGGTYSLGEPFQLTKDDSGTREHPITYAANPGEQVIISGGTPITGFRAASVNGVKMLAAPTDRTFHQLFVNGVRRPRTRLPKEGYYHIAGLTGDTGQMTQGQDSFQFGPGDVRNWHNLGDVDVVALTLWIEMRMGIRSVDTSANTVALDRKSTFALHDDGGFARYSVENVFEALDTPGEWYLDTKAHQLYYYPLPGETPKKLQVAAPQLTYLVVAEDVEHVTFSGLTFRHTEFRWPNGKAGSVQAAFEAPAAITFRRCRDCTVERCEISGIGAYAIEAGEGCDAIRVQGNRMTDLGAGGVKIQHDSRGTTVEDNDIGDGGKILMSGEGVWIGNSPDNRVIHNHIHDLDYTGVSVGWSWGYGESKAINNLVESNHIHNVGRGVLSDLGGIYTLGISPGTKLRNNLIHDSLSYTYGGWGIYTDEGSSGILIENNIVYNTKTGSFHQHYGKENVLRNNIFAFAKQAQLQRSRLEPHTSFTFDHNIVYFNEGDFTNGVWSDGNFKMDNNVYFDASGRPIVIAGAPFADWQAKGQDVHSVVADPLFDDPAKFDFHLKPNSPALAMGFHQIDVTNVGPRGAVGPPGRR